MKRGLKLNGAVQYDSHCSAVKEDSPMKRGLKFGLPGHVASVSRR